MKKKIKKVASLSMLRNTIITARAVIAMYNSYIDL